ARMIMMGLKFMGDVPFREVYIHGLVRDAHGQKMSKSKGNVLDPIDLIDGIDLESLVQKRTSGLMQPEMAKKIEKATRKEFPEGIPAFGTDALRFTFAALASTGRDINFDLGRIEGYRNFCNKLWNAARYVLMNTEGRDTGLQGGPMEFSAADRWILSRFEQAKREVIEAIEGYRFDLAAQALYEFTWNEYCDWYLELSKPVLQSEAASEAQKRGARRTLIEVLEAYLRLLHPLTPFITEEIWQSLPPHAKRGGASVHTIMVQPYPERADFPPDEEAERAVAPIKAVILGARQIRGQLDVPRSRQMPLYVKTAAPADWEILAANESLIRFLANVTQLERIGDDSALPPTAMQLVEGCAVHAPLASLIDDPDAELARLAKRKTKARQDLARCEAKLANQKFVANAPAEIVAQERARIAEFTREIEQLEEQERRVGLLKTHERSG
ncbi:MAG TPA: class I tRNA ligase family protein, partial [Steroidobacter sp.]|nr:class I tRNA ligase family protein [Steroidobacter sp.]